MTHDPHLTPYLVMSTEARLKSKYWWVTINNPTCNDVACLDAMEPLCEYILYQGEKSPDTGTIHIQCFLSLVTRDRLSSLSKKLPRANLKRCFNPTEDTPAYCRKESTRVEQAEWNAYWHTQGEFEDVDIDIQHEYGTWVAPVRGQAKPVSVAVKMIVEGASLHDVAVAVPEAIVSRGGGLKLLKSFYPPECALGARDVEVTVYWGPTGCGKSYKALTENPDAYVVRSQWWNGYVGQETVVFDDFDSSVFTFTQMLQYLDIWQCQVPIKGDMCHLNAKKIILTSVIPPSEWYPNARGGAGELRRRIHKIIDLSGWREYGRETVVDWFGYPVPFVPSSSSS